MAVNKLLSPSPRIHTAAWWRRTYAVMRELDNRADLDEVREDYAYYLAALSHGNLKPESFGKISEAATNTLEEIRGLIKPWLPSLEERKKATDQRLLEEYKAAEGDPESPEYQARIAREMAEYYERAARIRAEEREKAIRESEAAKAVNARLRNPKARFQKVNGKIT